MDFSDLKLGEPLARAVLELGYTTPTEIQQKTLPILLAGPTDFIGQAATGTGKTAAFGLPLLEQVEAGKKHVQGLILCPTRELAVQVAGQIGLFGKHKGVKSLPIYGGASYQAQLDGLKRGAEIVVGTPGRLVDLIERQALKLGQLKTLVLDEADEMISMGFKDELERILNAIPRDKAHTWLFSATMSPGVRKVADQYLRKPKQVHVNREEMLSTTVEQIYYPCREGDKPELVCRLIEAADDFYGIVFCQTKASVMDLTQYLLSRGYKTDCLHGERSQTERERIMKSFRDRKLTLLVCTDVASRGLDVKDLTHVINYSLPRELDLYVHRIGRTARSGKAGMALSLVTQQNRYLVSRIEHMTKSRMKEGRPPTPQEVAAKRLARILEDFKAQDKFIRAAELLGPDWELAIADMDMQEIIARFLTMLAPDLFGASAAPGARRN